VPTHSVPLNRELDFKGAGDGELFGEQPKIIETIVISVTNIGVAFFIR
jgi:hypothetical protein